MERVLILYPGESNYVALWQPGAQRGWVQQPIVRSPKRGTELYTAIKDLLQSQSLPITDLTHIGVMHGPASYAGLRSFVATANSLAWALRLPIFSFSPETLIPES